MLSSTPSFVAGGELSNAGEGTPNEAAGAGAPNPPCVASTMPPVSTTRCATVTG